MARIVKRIIELYSTDEADDLAAVDGVVIDDTGTLGDSEDAESDDDAEESDEEPEERPRSRSLPAPQPKQRRR